MLRAEEAAKRAAQLVRLAALPKHLRVLCACRRHT